MSVYRPRRILVTALVGLVAFGGGFVLAAQPHMQNALNALQGARAQLVDATSDKDGHRVKAISLVDDAIREVRIGIVAGAF